MQTDKLLNLIKFTKKLNILYAEDNIEVQTQTVKMLQSFFNNIKIATRYLFLFQNILLIKLKAKS